MLKKVMVRAHEIARKLVGHYAARLKMALVIAWKEAKEVLANESGHVVIGTKLNGWISNRDSKRYWESLHEAGWDMESNIESEEVLEITLGDSETVSEVSDECGDEKKVLALNVSVRKETEKAIELVIAVDEKLYFDGELEEDYQYTRAYWIPKSQFKIENGTIAIPAWLARKNDLIEFGSMISVVTGIISK